MFNPAHSTETSETTAPSGMANAPTEAELLDRAKAAVEANDQSLHDAAEALAETRELHGTSQAEMARAIGKSEAWVSKLLKWSRAGYKAESPFGPRTKAGRLEHAKDRSASDASKPRKARNARTQPKVAADGATASAERRKAENAERYDEQPETAIPTERSPLVEFKATVDCLFPKMDDAAKGEAVAYAIAQGGCRCQEQASKVGR